MDEQCVHCLDDVFEQLNLTECLASPVVCECSLRKPYVMGLSAKKAISRLHQILCKLMGFSMTLTHFMMLCVSVRCSTSGFFQGWLSCCSVKG